MVPILRSLLFVPGNVPKMLDKAMGCRPDAYLPDMEDSVPEAEKPNARCVIGAYVARLSTTGPLVIPRVNALDTGLTADDLEAVVGPEIDGVSVGKVHTADDVREITDLIGRLEQAAGVEVGRIGLIPWVESAKGVVHCYAVCTASPRIIGVAFGAEDYTHDMGIERLGDETDSEVAFARNTVCVAARAAGVPALDTPYFKFKDNAGLQRNALASKRCGFKGKFAIHPAQIRIINRVFSPSVEEIEQARRVVAAFEAAERTGRGSTSLDGQVVDVPVVKRARNILALAESMPESAAD